MKNPTFLYIKPFLVETSPTSTADHLLEYLTDNDRQDEEKLHAILLQFAVNEDLVEVQADQFRVTREDNLGSWIWQVNWMNFRSLVDSERFNILLNTLEAAEQHPMNTIIDLHSRLGVLFDHRFLNTLVNRTISSMALVPYTVPADKPTMTWEDIHKEAPFIWVLLLLQTVIRTSVKPLK